MQQQQQCNDLQVLTSLDLQPESLPQGATAAAAPAAAAAAAAAFSGISPGEALDRIDSLGFLSGTGSTLQPPASSGSSGGSSSGSRHGTAASCGSNILSSSSSSALQQSKGGFFSRCAQLVCARLPALALGGEIAAGTHGRVFRADYNCMKVGGCSAFY
jgi:hypothetical protein